MKVPVLDHGYVELVESWGSEERIIEAARMSTGKGFLGWGPRCSACGDSIPAGQDYDACSKLGCLGKKAAGDEKLLRYLYTHRHLTPFEMAGATFEVQAPIMVFREWHRHRTQSYNELSARYTPLPDVNYLPTHARCVEVGQSKQAQGAVARTPTYGELAGWLGALERAYAQAQLVYQRGLDAGIPKELARLIVPVGRYSRMRASANLRNWLQFLDLRLPSSAQWEIRQYAGAVRDALEQVFPRTMALFAEGRP